MRESGMGGSGSLRSVGRHNRRGSSVEASLQQPSLLQQKLKKQIDSKFNKMMGKQEANRSTQLSPRRRSSSLLMNNPLAKSSFSLSDTITHKAAFKDALEPIKKAVKSIMSSRKLIAKSYREKYNSLDENFFQTGALTDRRDAELKLKSIQSAKEPFPSYRSQGGEQNPKFSKRNNKFKLLIKEKTTHFRSASERKIMRIDIKIKQLKTKNVMLQSLMPVQKPRAIVAKVKPKGEIIGQEKIVKLVGSLIRNLELYFNMYTYNNIVGGHLRNIEGYSDKIQRILMIDENRARRITKAEEITTLFWVFRAKEERPEYFGEEDLTLYNNLNNFLMKMEKNYADKLTNFNYYENRKKMEEKESLNRTYKKYEEKMGRHEQINKINNFIENRLRFDQDRREEYMQALQKRGVKLNLIERSREIILRQKQNAMKRSLQRNTFK